MVQRDDAVALLLCLLFAVLSGLVHALGGVLMAYSASLAEKNGGVSKMSKFVAGLGVVVDSVPPGMLGIIALSLGPLSVVVVTRSASLLAGNVILTVAFGLGQPTTNEKIGTLLV